MALTLVPQVDFPGDSEMHALTRQFDWAGTSIGPPAQWPECLKTTVHIVLGSNHPMFVWWGPDLIQFYNDAYRQTMGPERHPSALAQPGRECWEEIWPIIGPQIESVMAGGPPTWHVAQLVPVTRHGRREDVWWTYGYSPIKDASGIGGVLVVCNDVTNEHLAKKALEHATLAALQESQRRKHEAERLQVLFQQAPGFMAILRGPDHVFEFANDAYRRLVGDRDLLGRSSRDALPEVEGQGFFELLDQAFWTGQPYTANEVPLSIQRTHDSPVTNMFIDFVYQPIVEADGSVSGIFVEGIDVTERKGVLEKLKETDRRKDEFLAMLAHELRNPLAPITAAAQALDLGKLDPAGVKKANNIILRQAGHMTGLVDDLLDVSRVTRGLVTLRRRPTDLNQAVAAAWEQVAPGIGAQSVELQVRAGPEPAMVSGDPERLVQIVTNLLNNAFKYTPKGGRIEVSVEARSGQVLLVVRDDGIGMEPALIEGIFELFTQGSRSPDRSQGGLGIGLAVVKTLVELHGGTVTGQSDGIGLGSRFEVRLPALATQSDEQFSLAATSTDRLAFPGSPDRRQRRDRRRQRPGDASREVLPTP